MCTIEGGLEMPKSKEKRISTEASKEMGGR